MLREPVRDVSPNYRLRDEEGPMQHLRAVLSWLERLVYAIGELPA